MISGFATTMQFLRRSRNEAVVDVLAVALDSIYPAVRLGALEILAGRRETAGHEAIIERARQLDNSELAVLRRSRHQMHAALRRAICSDDPMICENVCRLVLALNDYTLFGPLVAAAERRDNPNAPLIAATVVRLAAMIESEAQAPAIQRSRQDPYFARRTAIQELDHSIDRFPIHERYEMIEALLVVVPHDHEALLKLFQPGHPAQGAVLKLLYSNTSKNVLQLLCAFLHDSQAPRMVLELIAQRSDRPFLEMLLRSAGSPVSLRALRNIEHLHRVAWLQEGRDVLLQVDGPAQAAAVELAIASSIPPADVFPLLSDLLRFGAPEGRLASCNALVEFRHVEANQLIREALDDADVRVRAAAARQVRRRGLYDLQPKLFAMLESPDPELRQAAGEALGDYSFHSYRSTFSDMAEDERRTLGRLVNRSDPTAVEHLTKEFTSPSPSRRQQAIEMARAMELVTAVAAPLIRLLTDETADVSLRVAAVEALAEGDPAVARSALEGAAQFENPSIREAARQALAALAAAEEPALEEISR